ncbi:type II secretion system protein [Patescibacteria group bacterium]|nr:type II secretion system protein [Patescibacteria group bacterium]
MKNRNLTNGFTFVELVVVVGIFIVLLSVLLITVNPSEQYRVASDEKRMRDVARILNALEKWLDDGENTVDDLNSGKGIPKEPKDIGSGEDQVNLCRDLVPKYLNNLPYDIDYTNTYYNDCDDYYTGYDIVSTTSPDYQIIISAPNSGYRKSIVLER